MARKIRIEYPGAFYHVINRGNYRSHIFETEGACHSFLKCLAECCEAQEWIIHAWCLMPNHYHLLIETPRGNLVHGMRWLQSTFANRFNRFRKELGHVFQGRYRAILLDPPAQGAVCHYIHLNPVRAGLVRVQNLEQYPHSSFYQLWHPRKRWPFGSCEIALDRAGGLKDTVSGRSLYRDYLAWLSSSEEARLELGFAQMCRGWAKGTDDFRQTILASAEARHPSRVVESEARELREKVWEQTLQQALAYLDKTDRDLRGGRKGERWKIALATALRDTQLTPHRWLAARLHMGSPSSVQSWVSRNRHSPEARQLVNGIKKHGKLD